MRMWNVNPKWMCDAHLLEEHQDMHTAAAALTAGRPLTRHVKRGVMELHHIRRRHDRLEEEIQNRHLAQQSPLGPCPSITAGAINVQASRQKLLRSCEDCRHNEAGLREAQEELRIQQALRAALADLPPLPAPWRAALESVGLTA